jgi:voltage-gated potassium channel
VIKKASKTPRARRSEIVREVLDDVDSVAGRRFSFFIQSLVIFSLVTFSISTLPGLSDNIRWWLDLSEVILVAIFTIEYVLRVYVAESKAGFVFSFFGLIDLIAILPFYLSMGIDLRSLRIFRLLRLFRILKLLRYSQAARRFHRALMIAKEELILFSCVAIMLLYLSAVGIYYFENVAQPEQFKSVFHSLWWALSTLTTVGYGDIYPITMGGKIFTFFVLINLAWFVVVL